MVLWTMLAFSVAVSRAVPGATPVIGMATAGCPSGMVAICGTPAIPGLSLVRPMVVGAGWTGVIVAVSIPVPPWVTGRAGGWRLVSVGGGIVPNSVRIKKLSGALVRRTWRVFSA